MRRTVGYYNTLNEVSRIAKKYGYTLVKTEEYKHLKGTLNEKVLEMILTKNLLEIIKREIGNYYTQISKLIYPKSRDNEIELDRELSAGFSDVISQIFHYMDAETQIKLVAYRDTSIKRDYVARWKRNRKAKEAKDDKRIAQN